VRPAVRMALRLGAVGLGGAGAAVARAAIVGTAVLGLWPILALVGRRLATSGRD